MLPEYNQWFDMKQRCTSERSIKLRPSYSGCTIDQEWLSYDKWLDWARTKYGFLQRDSKGRIYQIDKDLIGDGKHYGADTCVFLPKELNQALQFPFSGFQIMNNGSHRVVVVDSLTNKRVSLGCFKEYSQAAEVFSEFKENTIRSLADKFIDEIDEQSYNALKNWKCPNLLLLRRKYG